MKRQTGFTLIELLMVISIIGVLSAIMISSVNSARGKSRDATRLHDLQQLRTAFNLYANDNGGNFPLATSALRSCIGISTGFKCWDGYTYSTGNGYDGNTSLVTALAPYIASIPLDPLPTRPVGDAYIYTSAVGLTESWHCTNPVPPIKGPFIVWEPENTSPNSDKYCGSGSFACCGPLHCGSNYFCVLPLN